jgi:cob(I)alamin adenosyltransferase
MKLYTGTGDRGKTSLLSGERRWKSHGRVEAYGALDELNACLGSLAAAWAGARREPVAPGLGSGAWSADQLTEIQGDLLLAGAWIATTPEAAERQILEPLKPDRSQWLEQAMDRMDKNLPPLRSFILPAGHPVATWAHLARTICRRAERRLVAVVELETDPAINLDPILIYLNRLSDYLFTLARWANHTFNVNDQPWSP